MLHPLYFLLGFILNDSLLPERESVVVRDV